MVGAIPPSRGAQGLWGLDSKGGDPWSTIGQAVANAYSAVKKDPSNWVNIQRECLGIMGSNLPGLDPSQMQKATDAMSIIARATYEADFEGELTTAAGPNLLNIPNWPPQ